MARSILDSSGDAPASSAQRFGDLEALDEELASQLPSWDLLPPHRFLSRKPRKPKPVQTAPQPSMESAPADPGAAEPSPAEFATQEIPQAPVPVPELASENGNSTPSPIAGEGASPPVDVPSQADPLPEPTEIAGPEPELDSTPKAEPDGEPDAGVETVDATAVDTCWKCNEPLEPGSTFCSECGSKQ